MHFLITLRVTSIYVYTNISHMTFFFFWHNKTVKIFLKLTNIALSSIFGCTGLTWANISNVRTFHMEKLGLFFLNSFHLGIFRLTVQSTIANTEHELEASSTD